MEILKYGNNYKIDSCGNCGCVFKWLRSDLIHKKNIMTCKIDNSTRVQHFYYLKCPQCGHKISMGEQKAVDIRLNMVTEEDKLYEALTNK